MYFNNVYQSNCVVCCSTLSANQILSNCFWNANVLTSCVLPISTPVAFLAHMAFAITWRPSVVRRKLSPQKPLDQLQPNFGGMVLGWPLPKLCPVIPTSNQDGRQAKNRKKGGMEF